MTGAASEAGCELCHRTASELPELETGPRDPKIEPLRTRFRVHSQLDHTLVLCRLDIPKAPQLVAALHARGVAAKAVPLQSLQQACEGIEDLTDRRDYAALVLQCLQASP